MSETRPHKRSVIHPRGSILPAFHVRFAANEFKFDSKHNPLPSFSLCSTADEIDSSLGEGDSVYRGVGGEGLITEYGGERMEEKRTLWREVDPREGVREACPNSLVFPIALSRHPSSPFLPPFQLAVWFRRVSALLPFKPLCMSTVTRETAPLSLPPSPSLVSFNNQPPPPGHYEGKRLGLRDFPQSLCASDVFRVETFLPRSLTLSLFLSLSFSLHGSAIQGFN